MKDAAERLAVVYRLHRLEANRARCHAADGRVSRFTKDDAERDQAEHTRYADTLEYIMKHWAPKQTPPKQTPPVLVDDVLKNQRKADSMRAASRALAQAELLTKPYEGWGRG